MPVLFDVGRVCVKITGRESGRRCVVIDIIDKNYVLVTGPRELTGIKRRRANVRHLEPTEDKVKIEKSASDEEVLKALKEVELSDKMTTVKPEIL